VLRFVDLGAGNYQAEVRASLDGANWTPQPARLSFKVLSPWYLRPVSLVIFALIVGALLYLAHRTRVAFLMRLQRQRAQIARDLHDEMGSGLGSIGILSALAAQGQLDEARGRDVAKKIADTAGELGNTLTEIVWTLRPGDTTLEALAYHLSERATRLFPGDETTFAKDFPARWPRIELSLAARRNLLLIASEALHNAARHAQARRVLLGFAPDDRGRRWRMWVSDDGRGFQENGSDRPGSGMGLQNMRRRAEEIGAEISWTNEVGTEVSVSFDPKTKGFDAK
jgi:signal transduction histidine kinase